MPVKQCGWFNCRRRASKHVIFAVRVHEAASARPGLAVDEATPNPAEADLCGLHVAHVENHYLMVEIRELKQ